MKNRRAIIITAVVIVCTIIIFLILPSKSREVKLPSEEEQTNQSYDKAKELMQKGDLYSAREELVKAYNGNFSDEIKKEIKDKMIGINEKLLFSREKTPDAELYKVQGGDTLDSIAKTFNTEYKQIMYFNKLKTEMVHPDQVLKILKGKFTIKVYKSKFLLHLLYDGSVFKEFKVAIGKENLTPVGNFKISDKEENPAWYYTDEETGQRRKIDYGDPRNVLGDRWMSFDEPYKSYGIHGTTDETSIGTAASKGCVRMRNQDVKELYNIVIRGTEVEIVD